jgi:two-component system sensor histidine kinase ResE
MNDQIQAGERSQRDFIANVSHDLKTPLTSIQGFSQAILDGTINSKDELMHAAKVINDESTRMHSMVMDILELAKLDSKVEKYYEEDIDLVVILERIIEDLSNEAKRKSILIRKEFNTLPVIKGDSDRLFLALYNLVDNAIKYSRENGEVIIRANSANNILKISIFDSGPGIPDDELERVFERFYQTDKSRQGGKTRGVGLGLTITKEIISIHHGDAYAMNRKDLKGEENNLGSVFVIELPIHHSDDK